MKLLLKRDDFGESHPHPDQLEVGELVINSVTGKIYSKLVDGSIVEWSSQKVCFDPVPDLSFSYDNIPLVDTLNSFCCAGDIIVAKVMSLKPEPKSYTFEFTELTTNTSPNNIVLSPTQYSNYTVTQNNQTVSLRQAIIPINLSITNSNNISIFKFTILSEGRKLTEKLLTIKCFEQACTGTQQV